MAVNPTATEAVKLNSHSNVRIHSGDEMRWHDLPILRNNRIFEYLFLSFLFSQDFLKILGQGHGNFALPPTWSPHRVPLASLHACF